MIAGLSLLLGFGLLQGQAIKTITIPFPGTKVVSLQAIVELPQLDETEMAALPCLTDCMMMGSKEFTPLQIRSYGAQVGGSLRAVIMPDHVRVQMVVPAEDIGTGIGMIASVLRDPSFFPDYVQPRIEASEIRSRTFWENVVGFPPLPKDALTIERLKDLHTRVFRPERTTFVVGGAFSSAQFQELLRLRFGDWTPPRPGRRIVDYKNLKNPPKPPFEAIELLSPAFGPTSLGFHARLLATYALAVGKGSSVHRVWREQMAWSYYQSGILWPDSGGFRLRILMLRTKVTDLPAFKDLMRQSLVTDVSRWKEDDRQRAIGVSEACLLRALPIDPIWISPNGPASLSIEDQTSLRAYWLWKTGRPWNAQQLHEEMGRVSLDELKAAALELLKD